MLQPPVKIAASRDIKQRFRDQLTGQTTQLMPTHAISHCPDTVCRMNQVCIFIIRPHIPGTGRRSGRPAFS
jgi:hypothetical protein